MLDKLLGTEIETTIDKWTYTIDPLMHYQMVPILHRLHLAGEFSPYALGAELLPLVLSKVDGPTKKGSEQLSQHEIRTVKGQRRLGLSFDAIKRIPRAHMNELLLWIAEQHQPSKDEEKNS